jgi:hypothetical protein
MFLLNMCSNNTHTFLHHRSHSSPVILNVVAFLRSSRKLLRYDLDAVTTISFQILSYSSFCCNKNSVQITFHLAKAVKKI